MNIMNTISAMKDTNITGDVSKQIQLLTMSQAVNLIGSWEWDLHSDKLLWTDAMFMLRAIPVSADNLISIEENYKYVHEDDREMVKKKFESLKQKQDVEFEYRVVTPGGQVKIISAWAALFRDETGKPMYIRGTSQDITKLRQVETQLNELNQVLEYAEEMANMGNWQWKLKKNEFIFSKNLYRLIGCDAYEFEPSYENFLKFVYPPDIDMVFIAHKQAQDKKLTSSFEFRILRKDGQVRHLKSIGKLVISSDGEMSILGTMQDITAIKHSADRLEQLNQSLGQKNQALERSNDELACLSYVASHDLQEPLRKIQTFSKLISEKDHALLSEKGRDYFNRIESASQRMQVLIDDLLTYSRTTNSPKNFTKTDLDLMLVEAKHELKDSIEDKKAIY
jgi:PAS domain-containing protein